MKPHKLQLSMRAHLRGRQADAHALHGAAGARAADQTRLGSVHALERRDGAAAGGNCHQRRAWAVWVGRRLQLALQQHQQPLEP
jgi:hypothetical protein